MNKFIEESVKEFKERFNQADPSSIRYVHRKNIESFLIQKLEEQAKKYEACVPKKELPSDAPIEWLTDNAKGFNRAIDTIRKNMENL